jgi:two-component system OmpR family sensor kinase
VTASFTTHEGVAVTLEGEVGALVVADERRLGQILRNLVQNAVTHSPPDASDVVVRVTHDAHTVVITVTDHGAGIAPEHLDRIWERFYRVDPSRTRATGGMGLGLSVAKRLTEAMGGQISVTSVVGSGTTFTLRFPAATV